MKDSNVVKSKKERPEYIIRLSESKNSKGVYFMLYEWGYKQSFLGRPYGTYLHVATLGTNFEKAYEKAVKIIGKRNISKLAVVDSIAINTIKGEKKDAVIQGKYKGKTVEEIFEIDREYVSWIAKKQPTSFPDEIIEKCIKLAIEAHLPYRPMGSCVGEDIRFSRIGEPEHFPDAMKYKYRFNLVDQHGNKYKAYSENEKTYCRCGYYDYFKIFACTPIGTEKEYLTHIVEVRYEPEKRIRL